MADDNSEAATTASVDSPLNFPGQSYRDRHAASSDEGASDSGVEADKEPRKSPIEDDPSAGPSEAPDPDDPSSWPIEPFHVDESRLNPTPFSFPASGRSGANPFAGFPRPSDPGTDRRASRSKTPSPPSRPSTLQGGSPVVRESSIAPPNESRGKTPESPAPRPPSVKRTTKNEDSNGAQAGSPDKSPSAAVPPRDSLTEASPVAPTPEPVRSAPARKGKGRKVAKSGPSAKKKKQPAGKKAKAKAAPRGPRGGNNEGPAGSTRARGRVVFGFGDLEKLEKRLREEKRRKREEERED